MLSRSRVGTVINLFYRDMPRLSVDIDLVYLPIEDREATLKGVDTTLEQIRADLLRDLRGVASKGSPAAAPTTPASSCARAAPRIKIETSPVARGTVHGSELRHVSQKVEEAFGFAEMLIVSFEDSFGGKRHAADDRQHPRDLFDVKLLYEHEGLTDALYRSSLIYVASSGCPPHELVKPPSPCSTPSSKS